MATLNPPRPASSWPLFVGVLCLTLFAGLVLHQLQAKRSLMDGNPELLEVLATAEFLEPRPPSGPRASESPQWRGWRRDGVAWTTNLLTKWPEKGPLEIWKIPGGESYSSVAVAGGRVYTMLHEEDSIKESILCLHPLTGKETWRKSYDRDPLSVDYGNFPRATPTVDAGQVFTVGATGVFQCRGAEGGDLVWEHDLIKDYHGRLPKWGYAVSPLVLGERVFVNPGGNDGNSIMAFGRKTGKELWRALDDPAGYSSPIAITVGDTEQVVFFTGTSLVGLTADEGKLLWQFPWPTYQFVNAATPLAFQAKSGAQVHQYLFITSGYHTGCALLRVDGDAKAGFQVRPVFTSNDMACHFSSPVRYRDHVYGFDEAQLTCMSLRTGAVRWRQRGYQKGSVLLVENPKGGAHLLVMGEAGNLTLLEATPEPESTGPEPLAERPLSGMRGRYWAMPALADGRLYLRDEKHLFCLKLSGE